MIVKYLVQKWHRANEKPRPKEFARETARCLFDARGFRTNKVTSYERYFDSEQEAQLYIDANNALIKSNEDRQRIHNAAPALFEALEAMLRLHDISSVDDEETKEWTLNKARAAIKKAIGE
jgi:hypothetical protein